MKTDLLIVGAGLAGLYVGVEWLKTNPHRTCVILEKYGYTGGRIVTHHTRIQGRHVPLQWEAGAGRIHQSHHRVHRLLRHYGLTTIPLTGSWGSNAFTEWTGIYLSPLTRLSPSVLQGTTLSTLLRRIYGPQRTHAYLASFPYFSEFHTLRADLALDTFQGELRSPASFCVCAEGLSEWIRRMELDFVERGGLIQHHCEVRQIDYHKRPLQIEYNNTQTDCIDTYDADRVVVAIDAASLRHVRGLSSLSVLTHLRMEPLLRIYAVFPVHHGKSWFSELGTVVSDTPIRFFIPVRPDQGVAMISYTEGADAAYWMKMKRTVRERAVMNELRRLFPHHVIPDPLQIHSHPWTTGCTYWLPGTYDPTKESESSIQPFSNHPLYLCNESFAVMQSWMESALVQAEKVVQRLTE